MCRLLYNLEWDLIQRIELVNPFTTAYIRELKTITQAWFFITCTSYVSYWSWGFFGRFRVTIVSLASLISIFYFQYFQLDTACLLALILPCLLSKLSLLLLTLYHLSHKSASLPVPSAMSLHVLRSTILHLWLLLCANNSAVES